MSIAEKLHWQIVQEKPGLYLVFDRLSDCEKDILISYSI